MAIEDAAVLAACLNQTPAVAEAMQHYEDLRQTVLLAFNVVHDAMPKYFICLA